MNEIYAPEKWKGFCKPYKILCKLFNKEMLLNIIDNALIGHKEVFIQNFEACNQIYIGITKRGKIPFYY